MTFPIQIFELDELIVNLLDNNDLFSLHLTCKYLSSFLHNRVLWEDRIIVIRKLTLKKIPNLDYFVLSSALKYYNESPLAAAIAIRSTNLIEKLWPKNKDYLKVISSKEVISAITFAINKKYSDVILFIANKDIVTNKKNMYRSFLLYPYFKEKVNQNNLICIAIKENNKEILKMMRKLYKNNSFYFREIQEVIITKLRNKY